MENISELKAQNLTKYKVVVLDYQGKTKAEIC